MPTVARYKNSNKNIISFSSLKHPYHRLPNKNKPILWQEKYSKNLKDLIISTVGTLIFGLFTIFQSKPHDDMGQT